MEQSDDQRRTKRFRSPAVVRLAALISVVASAAAVAIKVIPA